MYCESCGNFIPDGQSFCSNCGAPAPESVAPAAQPAPAAAPAPAPAPAPVEAVPVAAPAAAPAPAPIPVAVPVAAPAPQQAPQAIPVAQPVYQQPVYSQQPMQPVYQQPAYTQQPTYAAPAAPVRSNGLAKAGLVFGILTVCFCWIPVLNLFFVSIFGLLGLIFSIIGVCRKKLGGRGKAIAGLILTVIGIAAVVTMYVLISNEIKKHNSNADFIDVLSAAEDLMEEILDTNATDNGDTVDIDTDLGIDSDDFYIEGDFATTDKGYISGVLHIDGFFVNY